jgi:hypothetical protein
MMIARIDYILRYQGCWRAIMTQAAKKSAGPDRPIRPRHAPDLPDEGLRALS